MLKVLNRSLSVLEVFLEGKSELSLSELAELSGLNIAAIRRIVATLVKMGYLDKSAITRSYSLGNKFLHFSTKILASNRLRSIALPFLINLSRLVNETVSMISWDGRQGVHIIVIPSNHLLRVYAEEGAIIQALHATALGKAILANIDEKDFNEFYRNTKITHYTPNTITALSDLKQQLLTIKQEGAAFNNEELHVGVTAVAAAVKNHNGDVIGAINVVGPSVRLTPSVMKKIAPAVKACAVEIASTLT